MEIDNAILETLLEEAYQAGLENKLTFKEWSNRKEVKDKIKSLHMSRGMRIGHIGSGRTEMILRDITKRINLKDYDISIEKIGNSTGLNENAVEEKTKNTMKKILNIL